MTLFYCNFASVQPYRGNHFMWLKEFNKSPEFNIWELQPSIFRSSFVIRLDWQVRWGPLLHFAWKKKELKISEVEYKCWTCILALSTLSAPKRFWCYWRRTSLDLQTKLNQIIWHILKKKECTGTLKKARKAIERGQYIKRSITNKYNNCKPFFG